jgi:hypothetical protein
MQDASHLRESLMRPESISLRVIKPQSLSDIRLLAVADTEKLSIVLCFPLPRSSRFGDGRDEALQFLIQYSSLLRLASLLLLCRGGKDGRMKDDED